MPSWRDEPVVVDRLGNIYGMRLRAISTSRPMPDSPHRASAAVEGDESGQLQGCPRQCIAEVASVSAMFRRCGSPGDSRRPQGRHLFDLVGTGAAGRGRPRPRPPVRARRPGRDRRQAVRPATWPRLAPTLAVGHEISRRAKFWKCCASTSGLRDHQRRQRRSHARRKMRALMRNRLSP